MSTTVDGAAPGALRLVGSHHLYPGPDGGWRLVGPDDTLERLTVSPTVAAALDRLLRGITGYPAAVAESGARGVLDGVLGALAQRELLTTAPASPACPPDAVPVPGAVKVPSVVPVLGTGPVAARVAELLVAAGHAVRGATTPDEVDLDRADALVACAGPLPDARWQELDRACLRSALAWHRCYREGGRHVVGPFSVPGHTPSYRDTRARRLAAARHPQELAASWRHLDEHHDHFDHHQGIGPGADPATSAVVAGILAADVLTWLEHGRIPTAAHQLVIHPDTLVVDRHPVLPLPVAAVDGWAEPTR